jgi:hypothetical protein
MEDMDIEMLNYVEPNYPYMVPIPGRNIEMMFRDSPVSTWLKTKNYPHVVGSSQKYRIYRFKDHKQAVEFSIKWA